MAGSFPRLPQRLMVRVETRRRVATSETVRRSGRLARLIPFFSLLSMSDIQVTREYIESQWGSLGVYSEAMNQKERAVSQVEEPVEAPVVNCRIGAFLSCGPYEIRQALQSGKCITFRRKNEASCRNFSLEEAKIFYDENGNAIDYALPYCDPDVVLDFAFTAGLVLPGFNPTSLLIGTSHQADGVEGWEEVEQGFNDLIYSAWKMSRSLLPPFPILVDGEGYEVYCLCQCNNLTCSANSGPVELNPLPFLSETK